jgi:hypothetical protein
VQAALVYQHATSERDREIAETMDKRIAKSQGKKTESKKRAKKSARRKKGDSGEADPLARVG